MIRLTPGIVLSTLMVVISMAAPPLRAQQATQDTEGIRTLKAELEAAKRIAREAEVSLQKAVAENARLKATETDLKNIVKSQDQTIIELQLTVKKVRTMALSLDVEANKLANRNQQLLRECQDLSAKLARLMAAGPFDLKSPQNPNPVNPPDPQVKGKISKIDPDNEQLIVISLGTDHGVKVGHTLEVFRTTPEPKYLGMVRIISVTTDSAVGRQVVPPGATDRPALRVGDHAWSKLTN